MRGGSAERGKEINVYRPKLYSFSLVVWSFVSNFIGLSLLSEKVQKRPQEWPFLVKAFTDRCSNFQAYGFFDESDPESDSDKVSPFVDATCTCEISALCSRRDKIFGGANEFLQRGSLHS